MVAGIRNTESALGDGVKRPSASEIKNREMARRSIVAEQDISTGELFTEANVAVKRPGAGVSPMRWDEVIGARALRDYVKDEQIEL